MNRSSIKAGANTSRISTGIKGCDEIFAGGLIPGRSYLISGAAGAGKTIFSLQWLRAGVPEGQKAIYITLSEPAAQLERNIEGFGWSMHGITLVDLSPAPEPSPAPAPEYHVFPPSEVERTPAWEAIYRAIDEHRPDRVVLDALTQLRYLATDEYQFRKNVLNLVNYLNGQGITSFLAFEPHELEHDVSAALAVDGVIRLRSGVSAQLAIGIRSLQIEKFRGSDFMSGFHPLRIRSDGISVFAHRVEHTSTSAPGNYMVSSGIARLDELLGGGLESGTTTLLTGPTGTGKSTLGTQYLATHARECGPAILFTFEEPESFITRRSRGIGAPIDDVLASGALKIVRINPLEQYPDEFLANVREAVEVGGNRMVMIDSLRGYQFAMEEFGKTQAHIHNLVTYLQRLEVTTLLVNEVEHITSTSLKATDLGVSHLADNIILLRYAEHAGRVTKIIGCLKKRIGNFQPELRNIEVGTNGIHISEKLQHLRGILTGTPVSTREGE
ncbi:MAG: kaiC [Paucimonas sp.]|nr:kaiC [Paucimonas sp.]